jgi:NADPH:quinone reductase
VVLPLARLREPATSPHDPGRIAAIGRAAIVSAPGTARIVEQNAPPEPAHGDVRIRIEGCGVCASSIPVWEGRQWFSYPLEPGAPGHEGWGTIDAIGAGVEGLKPGDRVAAISQHAFATWDFAAATAVVPLPSQLANMPFPGEPLGCALNVFRRSGIDPAQDVAIVGVGFLGALLTRLAANAGARVIAISRRRFALDIAREFGAADTITLESHDVVGDVRRLTGGRMCQRVIEAVGMQWSLDLAGELAAERGRLLIAGYHQDGARQVNMQQWNWRGLDVVNAHERDPAMYVLGMREAVKAVARGLLDPSPLYTHTYPLEELGRAFGDASVRPDGFMKAVVCP